MECFNLELLCRYIDAELDGQQRVDALAHLRTCPRCAEQLRLCERYDSTRHSALPLRQTRQASACTQYTDTDRSAYVSEAMQAQEAAAFAQHLRTCDVCVGDVMGMHRTRRLLQREPLLAPPAPLRAAAQSEPVASAPWQHLGGMIIQVSSEGLTFLAAHALPAQARLSVDDQRLPAGAWRSRPVPSRASTLLDIRQQLGDFELHLSALHEEKATVCLTIHVQQQGQPLRGERVSLYRDGRLQYSRRTATHGEVTFARLTAGEYTIRLAQAHIETQCILRAGSDTMPSP